MALQDSESVRAWGVLFALSLKEDRTIYGKVTLNKTLALLQRDGFPIRNKFVNKTWGPFDWHVHSDAEKLASENLVTIEEKPNLNKEPTNVYHLSENGFKSVQQKYSIRIENLPYLPVFRTRLEEIKRKFVSYKTPEIVAKVHEELLIDLGPVDFRRKLESLSTNLNDTADKAEKDRNPTCSVCLDVLGCVDFAITSLDLVILKKLDTNESSKNFVYFDAKEILQWANKLVRHDHVRYTRIGSDPLSRFREQMGYRLYCTEEICDLYEIVKPIRDELSLSEYVQTVTT